MFKKIALLTILIATLALSAFAPLTTASAAAPMTTTAWGETPTLPTEVGDALQTQATAIAQQATAIVAASQQIQAYAAQIQAAESNPTITSWAANIIALAAQTEQDAAAIVVTANDINTRIDNSEDTTLALSDDIGEMADRIGEMADRILWTELQIGVMADRIVESEYLISDSSLNLAQMIATNNNLLATNGNSIQVEVEAIRDLLP